MKVALTGGAGFIGSNLARELSKGDEILILDDLSTGRIENIREVLKKDNVTFVKGSITDLRLLEQSFKGIEYVLHQAAMTSVQRSLNHPLWTFEVNIKGTLNVLIAARDAGVKKVIYASSSSVYGDTPSLPKREDMEPSPLSPYAATKLTGEHYCRIFHEIYGLKTVSLRYFNVYGPRQPYDSQYAAVIPKFITLMLAGKSPPVYGNGRQTRDFTFVEDVVRASILALKKNALGEFNISTGSNISILDLVEKINQILGTDIRSTQEKPRVGDVRNSLGDISKAKKILGYEPRNSLEEGLRKTIAWFKDGREKKTERE